MTRSRKPGLPTARLSVQQGDVEALEFLSHPGAVGLAILGKANRTHEICFKGPGNLVK